MLRGEIRQFVVKKFRPLLDDVQTANSACPKYPSAFYQQVVALGNSLPSPVLALPKNSF
ncbi:hypothetical protein [Natronomonas gomsonensis]|uniref:hypothetical protein n=1 Tax=Natronomonas gomsonensis TaxID=1046043 RepID=UPI0020CA6F6B|nr:hypothetical protein [Natronomonas gomsonensis]